MAACAAEGVEKDGAILGRAGAGLCGSAISRPPENLEKVVRVEAVEPSVLKGQEMC